MKALVVYESMFGNTEAIARAVASGLEGAGATVTLSHVSGADPSALEQYDVVVAGAPTHAMSLPRPATRQDAVRQGAAAERTDSGLREWLDQLTPGGGHPTFAVFDSRVGVGKARHFTGSAAKRAARSLRGRHRVLADPPVSFYVAGTSGPLLDGEDVRARAWGSRLARDAQDARAR